MASPLSMVFDILAVDRASAVFTRVGAAAEGAGAKSEAGLAKLNKLAAGFALAGAAATVVAVKMAADFQQHTNVLVTAAGESQKALAGVRKGILDIASSTGTKWQDLTDGMYQIEKAGYRGADGLKILKASAQAAREEGANLATVTSATTSVMASYHLGAGSAVAVTNQIKTAAGEAKTTMEQFAGSLSTVLPLASANNISFADVSGTLASLTQHGTSADEAAQELAFAIRNLAAPSNVAVQAMNQLGISSTDVALKLGDGPGGRGLAGTMAYLRQVVESKFGPAGLVMLGTMKNSAQGAQDLKTMLESMPPALRNLAEQFNSGALTVTDYRATFKGLPADQAALAAQYVTLYNRQNGFNDALKRGGPAAATMSAELKAMMGGANGLNALLQTTGESLDGTNERIAKVAAAAVGAGNDVSGWDSTQKLFNVRLDQFKQSVAAAAIDLGTKLLPAVSAVFGFLGEHKGLVEGFIASLLGISAVLAAYKTYTLVMAGVEFVTGGWILMLGVETRAKIASAAAGLALNSSLIQSGIAGKAATAGLAGLKAAAGLGALYYGVTFAIDKMTDSMAKARPNITNLTRDLLAAGGSSTNLNAGLAGELGGIGKSVDLLVNPNNGVGAKIGGFFKSLVSMSGKVDLQNAKNQLGDLDKTLTGLVSSGAADQASKAFDTISAAAKDQGVSVDKLKQALPGYTTALQAQANQQKITGSSADALKISEDGLKGAQDKLNSAVQDSINKFTILNQGALTTEAANEALTQKTNDLAAAVKQNGSSLDVTTQKGAANRAVVVGLIQASNDKITADFKSASATDGVGAAMTAASGQIAQNRQHLIDVMVQSGFTKKAAEEMAAQFLLTPDQVATQFNTPGLLDAQTNVNNLQTDIDNLKDKDVHINAYLNSFSSNAAFQAAGNSGNKSQASKLANIGGQAQGGPVPMMPGAVAGRDSVAAVLMPHEFIVRADGSNLGDAVAHFGKGMAAGGPVVTAAFGGFDTSAMRGAISSSMDNATANLTAAANRQAQAQAASFSGGGGGAGSAGIRALGQSIAAAMGFTPQFSAIDFIFSHESGWNPNAQNPTSTAYGIPQFLNGTWAQYGGKTSDPATQIRDGIRYMVDRYGSPNGAAAFWQGHHWYEKGTNYVPETQLAVVHKGEAIVPAQYNKHGRASAVAAGPVAIHIYDVDNRLIGTMDGRIDAANADAATAVFHA